MKEIENIIGYVFNDKKLLNQAFIHSSYGNEYKVDSYENLEFLGDSVLSLVISEQLLKNYHLKEGEMTKLRANIVSSKNLTEIIKKLSIEKYIKLGKSMKNQNNLPSIQADIFESILGAIYIDGGYDNAQKFVLNNIVIDNYLTVKNDYKTMLQEVVQAEGGELKYNTYSVEGTTNFCSEVTINNKKVSVATSFSKKDAETKAAEIALKNLKD